MVLNGIINYNGTEYGIGIGNVFTATSASSNYIDVSSALLPYPPLVIEYYDVDLLSWTPNVDLGDMVFDSFGTGICNCGNRMYFHRLKSSSAGVTTSWSYGMFPVHVGLDQNPTPIINSQHYYVGAGTDTTIVNSNKSVKITIDNIDTKFDTIEIACAEFDQKLEVPTDIKIVISTSITSTKMTFEDFGNSNLGTLTLDDLTLFPASILKCKTLTTNKNYNVIANITEREEFQTFDTTTVSLTDYTYQMPVDNESSSACSNTITFGGYTTPINPVTTANPALTGAIQHGTKWVVTLGTVEYPLASGTFYNAGDVFEGNNTLPNYKNWGQFTPGAQIRPANFMRRYVPLNNTSQRYDVQQIKTSTGWDYRNPLVASMSKGYRSSEKYRFGILFYDKKRNPFYVRWLGDHTFQSIYAKNGLMTETGFAGDDWWVLNANLLNVSGLRIPKEIVDVIDGFSIVRAPCDPTIVTQGICWQTQYDSATSNISPLPSLTLDWGNGHLADPTDHVYSYICPDDLTNEPFTLSKLMNIGDTMRVVGWLESAALSQTGYLYKLTSSSVNAAQKFEMSSKLYRHINSANNTANNESTIVTYARVNEADTVTGFLTGNDFYNKDMFTGVTAGYTIDAVCISAGALAGNNITMVGGRKIAVKTVDDFGYYNYNPSVPASYVGYSDPVGGGAVNKNISYKALVNYMITNNNQYGGTSASALANTLYISTGHYQQIDAQVIADNCDTNNPSNYSYLEFNNIQVGGGDTFVCLIDHGYGLFDTGYANGASYGIMFPCETRVNFNLRRGRKISDFGMHMDNYGVTYSGGFSTNQGLEDYSYNKSYSSEGNAILYPALPINFSGAIKFPYRMRWAGQKISGEIIDSFRVFFTNDYRDADGRYGEINNVRPKSDYVYYWQNHAVGSVPILERELLSGASGASTSLGTGGVITRFDTISPKFGNQHQHGLTETEEGWIWFDMRNKDVCVMSLGGGVNEITVPAGMKSFFSEAFVERLSAIYSGVYLNSQTSDISSDRPLIGTGIVGVYDPKNKMSYLTFKFSSYYKENPDPTEPSQYQILRKDFTIGYSHVLNKFIAFYDKTPAIWHNHNQSVLSANDPKNINKYYASDMVLPVTFEAGDMVEDLASNIQYVFLQDYTLTSFPLNFSGLNINGTIAAISVTHDIYIENEEKPYLGFTPEVIRGYEYNFFYGRAFNNELEFVVTPKLGQISPTNYEMGATGDNITGLTISADNGQIGTDSNIKSYNRNYRYFDGSWWGNFPLFKGSRITDKYFKVKFTKKNWVTNPTIEAGLRTIIQYVKTFLEQKK
jgi:hypothetical protein